MMGSDTELMPLVTVVTGYYNRKRGLIESIQSVLNQDYSNFEYIVFDDCSNDGTYELLQQFSDPRLRLIRHEKNTGFTQGIINAIKLARGKYIAIHGAGDISLSNRLKMQVNCLNNHSIAIAGCFFDDIDEFNGMVQKNRKKTTFIREEFFNNSPISHGEVMFRKEQYFQVGEYRSAFKFVQDADLWLRLTKLGDLEVIQEVLYKRIIQPDGVSFHPNKAIKQSMFSIFARDINRLPEEKQKLLLDKCAEYGIESIVSYKDKRFQERLFRRFHTLIYYHDYQTMSLFLEYSTSVYKLYYALMLNLYRFSFVRKGIYWLHNMVFKKMKRYTK